LGCERAEQEGDVGSKLISADRLHAKWMKDPKYRKAYEELEAEFARASAEIERLARLEPVRNQRDERHSQAKPRR
jgi:hypothetical protein